MHEIVGVVIGMWKKYDCCRYGQWRRLINSPKRACLA